MPPQPTQPNPKPEPELRSHIIALMVMVSLFYDALQALFAWIFLGWLIIPLYYLTMIVWFKILGLSFLSMSRAPIQLGGLGLEALTAGIIPAFTLMTLSVTLGPKIKKKVGI